MRLVRVAYRLHLETLPTNNPFSVVLRSKGMAVVAVFRPKRILAGLLALAASLGVSAPLIAQAPKTVNDSVVAAVNEFFRTMTANDSAGAAKTVNGEGTMFSFQPRGDSTFLSRSTLGSFPVMLATNKRSLVERMWNPTVLVHGKIATVWAEYDFHINGEFSHCGVDAFTLAREPMGWRIVNVTYTVERTGCKPSPLGALKKPD